MNKGVRCKFLIILTFLRLGLPITWPNAPLCLSLLKFDLYEQSSIQMDAWPDMGWL